MLDKDSVEAGIYEMLQRRLMANVSAAGGAEGRPEPFPTLPPMSRIVSWMYAPDGRFGADPIAGRNALLIKSLEEAVAELSKRFGPDMEKWKLGAYHYARILSPMTRRSKTRSSREVRRRTFSARRRQLYHHGDRWPGDNQIAGGSFKIIVDTENWDNSVGLNSPGQSGDVNDPHYRDLYELWARGKYFPIFYSRSKVESVAESTWVLTPSSGVAGEPKQH